MQYRYSGIYYVVLYQASFYLVDAITFVEAYLCFRLSALFPHVSVIERIDVFGKVLIIRSPGRLAARRTRHSCERPAGITAR